MILHLTRDLPPRRSGGLSTAVENIVLGLDEAGMRSAVISMDGWGRKGGAKSDTLPRPRSAGDVFRARHKPDIEDARDFALARPIKLVHIHDAFLWQLGSDIAKKLDVPKVHSTHVLAHVQDELRGLETPTKTAAAQRVAIEQADIVAAPTPAIAERVADDFPEAAPRVRACRIGLAPTARLEATRAGLLFVGRFTDMAGISELVKALEHLGGLDVTVAGGLPDNPGAERRWIEALEAAASASNARLTFAGWCDRERLAALYARAAVVIAPNQFATFGLAVAEAMQAGACVCAYRVGGLPDLIGDAGVLLDPEPFRLAQAARKLLDDFQRREALGHAAAQRIATEFNLTRATAELLEVYRPLLP